MENDTTKLIVSVFGLGYVGCVVSACIANDGIDVIGVDKDSQKVKLVNDGHATVVEPGLEKIIGYQVRNGRLRATEDYEEALYHSSISLICVGTPSCGSGHLSLEAIWQVAEQIGEYIGHKRCSFHVVAIRSTVPPRTCERVEEIITNKSSLTCGINFEVVANPEFLREGSAIKDFYAPPYILVGTTSVRAANILRFVYSKVKSDFIQTDRKIAEIIKYVNNSFHALKVSFANEIGAICKLLEIDALKLMDIFVLDSKLNTSKAYLRPGFAYGGSCLPKDLSALKAIASDFGVDTPVLRAISQTNINQIKRVIAVIEHFKKHRVTIWGLSFKSNTDDLRQSPAVELVKRLTNRGYLLCCYDPEVSYSFLKGKNKHFIEEHVPFLQDILCNTFEEALDHADIIVLTKPIQDQTNNIAKTHGKIVIDLFGLKEKLSSDNIYYGISW